VLALLVAGPPERTDGTLNPTTLFGLCGPRWWHRLYGLSPTRRAAAQDHPFNLVAAACSCCSESWHGAAGPAAGLGGRPVPQGTVITGIVVAFSPLRWRSRCCCACTNQGAAPRSTTPRTAPDGPVTVVTPLPEAAGCGLAGGRGLAGGSIAWRSIALLLVVAGGRRFAGARGRG